MNNITKNLTIIITSTLISFNLLNSEDLKNSAKEQSSEKSIYNSFLKKIIPMDSSDEAYYFYLDSNNNPKFILEFLNSVEDTSFRRLNVYFTNKEIGKSALNYRPELAIVYTNGRNGYGFGLQIKNSKLYISKDPGFNDLYNYDLIPPEEVFRYFTDK